MVFEVPSSMKFADVGTLSHNQLAGGGVPEPAEPVEPRSPPAQEEEEARKSSHDPYFSVLSALSKARGICGRCVCLQVDVPEEEEALMYSGYKKLMRSVVHQCRSSIGHCSSTVLTSPLPGDESS